MVAGKAMAVVMVVVVTVITVSRPLPGSQHLRQPSSRYYTNSKKFLEILSLVAVALAAPSGSLSGYSSVPAYSPAPAYRPAPTYNEIPHYTFDYGIRDDFGNDYGHQESHEGYDTKGSYYVQLPDGRLQHVNYYVNGDSGYVAEVTYSGEAQYPAYSPAEAYRPAPTYSPRTAYTHITTYG